MTLRDYEALEQIVFSVRAKADDIEMVARDLEAMLHRLARVEYVSREPGFPCWTIEGEIGYYPTPKAAFAAKTKGEGS